MTTTTSLVENLGRGQLNKDELAAVVARDIPHGSFVNLGIGQPTLVADHLAEDSGVVLHTENGMLNMGPAARPGEEDPDLTNAGKTPVTELPGAAYFHHADSFAMMRGGHLDICVLGAFQVSAAGDLANWHTGAPDAIPAVGGAMDLATGAKKVFVMMNLFAKNGSPKLVPRCTCPLTGLGCVDRVYTEFATFRVGREGVTVLETFGLTFDDLAARLDLPLERPNGRVA
ncbi:3-oxoacid CoA-transferase subunit B [Streptomyces nodosus]